jgi:hypothetical protein
VDRNGRLYVTPLNSVARDFGVRSASSFIVALPLFAMSTDAAHSGERKLNWNCIERGGYAFSVDDVGRGRPTGNPVNGTNRLLFAVRTGDDTHARFLLFAYIDNKLIPQMSTDDKQEINIEFDEDDSPTSIRATWLGVSGAESFILEKSASTWRFVYTTTDIHDERIAKHGPPGSIVFLDSGDCVLNP